MSAIDITQLKTAQRDQMVQTSSLQPRETWNISSKAMNLQSSWYPARQDVTGADVLVSTVNQCRRATPFSIMTTNKLADW